MFLILNKDNNPIGVYEKLDQLIKDIENRIINDYTAFEKSALFGRDQFDLDIYLDMRILVCRKNEINWVEIDFELDEIYLYDFLNDESSDVIRVIDEYNSSLIFA